MHVPLLEFCEVLFDIWGGWHPPVGFFIAILAVVGVLMPLFRPWEKTGKKEKAAWTALVFLLFFFELRTLYSDRDARDHQQAMDRDRELQSFNHISDTLNAAIINSQDQFKITMQGVDKTFKKTNEAAKDASDGINGMIGQNSYLVLTPQGTLSVSDPNGFSISLSVLGKNIVWDAHVEMGFGDLTQDWYSEAHQSFDLKPVSNRSGLGFLGPIIHPNKSELTKYSFLVSTRGTVNVETLYIRFNVSTQRWEFEYWMYTSTPSLHPKGKLLKYANWTAVPYPLLLPLE